MDSKRYNFIKSMSNRELAKLALAVFMIFGSFGPASLLANGVLATGSWTLLMVVTTLSGGFSASIIFALRKPWLMVIVVIIFILAISNSERLASMISGKDESITETATDTVHITPGEFKTIKEKRIAFFALSVVLIGCGWMMFVIVLNTEGKKRGRLEAEMKIARDIQQSLLPRSSLQTSWCSISGLSIPTSEVGGDYFDAIKLSGTLVAVIIADVSGHGVGAGIITAMTKSALYSQLWLDPMPSSVLANLNNTLAKLTDGKTFVTCAYLLLDHSKGIARVATAGHHPVLWKHYEDHRFDELRTPNLGLGIKNETMFEDVEIRYSKGDILVLHTDGIIEAVNDQGEQFGLQRLQDIVASEIDPGQICSRIITAAQSFSGSKEFRDDATVVSISLDS